MPVVIGNRKTPLNCVTHTTTDERKLWQNAIKLQKGLKANAVSILAKQIQW